MSTSTSVRRRKPQVTYRSPPVFTVPIVGPSPPYFLHLPKRNPSTPATGELPLSQPGTSTTSAISELPKAKRRRLVHNAPLSLYHPLGPYAQSLPPLDPTLFGFPADVTIDEEVQTAAATAAKEPSPDLPLVSVEKVSQPARKKRGGKRKRKKLEEEDRTYIAAAKVVRTRSRTPLNQRMASPDTYEDIPSVSVLPEEDIEMAPPTPKLPELEPEPEPIERAPSPLRVVVAPTAPEPAPALAPTPPRRPSPIPAPRIIQMQQRAPLPPPPPPIPPARKVKDQVKEEGEISEDE
ncbi:hypothetical protein CYLTODRAFT_439203 [Cylindrobasidium torrendii FP15055 ss-10]|uniref:Uncharacterized protein n=1 Tax=Cylindrobasidium torrendii FP15055 ss-10 TaxID=1314674 RepID=A0A0D7BV32_9AGAR|nr:hypothetical protein CYLTODRAFT_439203 [Cylindrobasidium torrendii FP15055 ss-10]